MTPRHRVPGIRLHPDEARRATALAVGIVERGGLPAFASLRVGQEHGVVVALHDDLVFEPDAGHERRAGRVVLHGRLVRIHVPDAIARLDLVDRAGAVLVEAIGLRSNAVEVLGRVADGVVVDLDFEAGYYRLPGRVAGVERGL